LEELASDKNLPEHFGRFLGTSVDLESNRAAEGQINHAIEIIERLACDSGNADLPPENSRMIGFPPSRVVSSCSSILENRIHGHWRSSPFKI
jgi:hypothetical protein